MPISHRIEIAKNGPPFVQIEDFSLPEHKITFLFGESGIGKSILARTVYGLLDPNQLNVRIDDMAYRKYLQEDQTRARQESGFFVFQEPSSHLNPLMTLSDQLGEGSLAGADGQPAILRHLWDRTGDAAGDEDIQKILAVFPKPHRPSGGEKQRILLAMAFKKMNLLKSRNMLKNGFFVFDEPSGSLDNHFRNCFLDLLLQNYRHAPFTALFITHDYSIISQLLQQYPKMRDAFAFRELSRGEQGLQLNNFAPDDYLNWLKTDLQPLTASGQAEGPLLYMSSGYRVFGRTMRISRGSVDAPESALSINRGDIIYLKAASGVGKTTLVKIILGLQPCNELALNIDSLTFDDKTPRSFWRRKVWGRKAGMVFQHADEALNMKASVRGAFRGLPSTVEIDDDYLMERLQELFDMTISRDFLDKKIALLSGGQKQRVNILRTLILDTDLLIFDEPLNGLDFASIQRVIEEIREKQSAGKAILMISHNEEIFDALIPQNNIFYLS